MLFKKHESSRLTEGFLTVLRKSEEDNLTRLDAIATGRSESAADPSQIQMAAGSNQETPSVPRSTGDDNQTPFCLENSKFPNAGNLQILHHSIAPMCQSSQTETVNSDVLQVRRQNLLSHESGPRLRDALVAWLTNFTLS